MIKRLALWRSWKPGRWQVNEWLSKLLQTQGPDIFRMKASDAEDQRFVFQGVHMLFDGRADRPWKSRERKMNELCSQRTKLN